MMNQIKLQKGQLYRLSTTWQTHIVPYREPFPVFNMSNCLQINLNVDIWICIHRCLPQLIS